MSNPTFRLGPVTFKAAEVLEPFTLVQVGADGAKKATDKAVHGVVTEKAGPEGSTITKNNIVKLLPELVAVHFNGVVPVATDAEFAIGETVFAGADGKAAKEGTKAIGFAVEASNGGTVKTALTIVAA